MTERRRDIRAYWRNVRAKRGFRQMLTFLVFVVIATLFWGILALNDNLQEEMEVRIHIYNVPDSVTFITDPPRDMDVMVRDRGTNLWRNGVFSKPTVELNFREFDNDGVFYVSRGELTAGLKKTLGQTATLISTSIESLSIPYTTNPGKRVPIEVAMDLTAAVGKIISSRPQVDPGAVLVFGSRDALDTISKVTTEKVRGEDLEEPKTFSVKLRKIPGVRIEPSTVKVKVNVEQLVRKETKVNIQIDNLPPGEDMLLFPSMAKVEYYLPMSKFGTVDEKIEVRVDYRDVENGTRQLPLHLGRHSKDMENVRLIDQNVEYTLVKN